MANVTQETTVYIPNFQRTTERAILSLEPVDMDDWHHEIFMGARHENGNSTYVRYKIWRGAETRFWTRVVFGPDERTGTADNLKLDNGFVFRFGPTMFIGVVGHTTVDSGFYTLAFTGAWNGLPVLDPHAPDAPQTFTDVPPDNVFYPYIEGLAQAGVINGRPDGQGGFTYSPTQSIRRDAAAKINYLSVFNAG